MLQYASEQSLKLGVHYCSLENKHTGQLYQQNKGDVNRTKEILKDKSLVAEEDWAKWVIEETRKIEPDFPSLCVGLSN